ncbi:hypothetical protein FOZ63_002187, partial [Perkinsus olseni]
MNIDGFKGPMAVANSEPAALDYDIPLADLCAIGEPSLLANALAELQRNQEGSSSVILENFPLENWSDGASSIGGLSAPATYYSEPAHPPASMPTLAGYSQLDFSSLPGWADDRNQSFSVSNAPMAAADTWQRAQSSEAPPPPPAGSMAAHAFGLPADVSLYSPFSSASSSTVKGRPQDSTTPFGVRSGLNIRLAGEFAAVVEWGDYIVFAKASGPRQATGALVAVGRQHDRLALDVNVSASSLAVSQTEKEKNDAEAICEDIGSTIASGLSAVVVAEHYPKSVLPLNVSVVSCPPGG